MFQGGCLLRKKGLNVAGSAVGRKRRGEGEQPKKKGQLRKPNCPKGDPPELGEKKKKMHQKRREHGEITRMGSSDFPIQEGATETKCANYGKNEGKKGE